MAGNEEGALWSIFGYLISGLIIWGGIGFGLDKWLHTHFFLLGGLVLGASQSFESSSGFTRSSPARSTAARASGRSKRVFAAPDFTRRPY